ncbi:hypercellular protein [Sporothrix brasiliensis 5110]|uniref:Hypercellular protein n=1 Tax=Sporothrix brasiliensis 5110 TaxID=1398154 RepID=A0A0C2J7S5_9PEZI|nr:hypercellular protein [Sporothrix brasiliensis 5110]KIH95050.1 hypercellular protein [Sporothrix brasiliensis 5110]
MARSDPFLPVSPAQVKVLVLPVGPVHRDRFASFLDRLKSEYAVQLRDVSADRRPNRNMFSPLAFPDGYIFYDLTTHVPQPSHLALCPFDLYREPLVILALADGAAIKNVAFGSKRQSAAGRSIEERNIRTLYQELEELRDTYTKVLVHRVLIFDYEPSPDAPIPMPDEGMATVPPLSKSKRTTMKAVMADVSSLLLAEMNTLARSFDAMSYIESPGQAMGSVFRPPNGNGGGDDGSSGSSTMASRRNSQFALPIHRSSSVGSGVSAADRSQARMSMPVPFKGGSPFGSGSAGSTPGRPSTPVRSASGLSGPATTFDDIAGGGSGDNASALSSPDRATSPHDLGDGYRSQSQDRISVQGFGPGGLNERWRNKGKSRVTIVVASLYLQAGRWTDALKELIEGATVSRSINDHLWHGKALELIVVCLLLLSWADIEFQVPSVCLPPPEKGSAAQAAAQALEAAAEKARPNQPKWLRNLQQILPDLLDRILGLYTRISGEQLPPLPLAEATIRFCNILTALHVADGALDRRFLEMAVEGKYGGSPAPLVPHLSVTPSRALITTTLFRAFPSSVTELLTTIDRIVILSGIAAVLGRLGYRRKKAMVVRELLSVLIGGLVEARTRGAAEVGIHPAAGLVTQNGGLPPPSGHANGAAALDLAEGDIESGVEAFLGMLLKTYGVVEFEPSAALAGTPGAEGGGAGSGAGSSTPDDSDEAVVARIREQATVRLFGMPGNKLNLLRACINFSEALPDFAGVLKFSSDLLRTAGSGIAPGQRRDDAAPTITKDEQVRLVTNIAKTSNLSRRLALGDHLAAEYWDEFLVRGVKLEPVPAACQPIAHTRSELPGKAAAARTSQDVDPFIHNSFLKPSEKAIVEQILVAQEPATFKLTLQNPYDIEVEIESIRIETDGVDFEAYADSACLGPYRTQIVKVSGMPQAAGSLHVTGAVVRVRGCRERRFPVFTQPWSPDRPDKIKHIGMALFEGQRPEPPQGAAPPPSPTSAGLQLATGPPLKAERLSLTVIPAQPMVVVESTTLPQSSVMVLEGERQVFSVTLKNLSATTPVDFLLFSFQDSTQASIQAALSNRDASPAELYEYELILAKKQALRLRSTTAASKAATRYIGPGATATFDFEILGKPGLTSGTIQVDYAHLGTAASPGAGAAADDVEVAAKFYTRQVSLHLTVTVNASIEIARMDVLPLHGSIPQPLWDRYRAALRGAGASASTTDSTTRDKYCLLLLDLRNAWPGQMRVELGAEDGMVVTEHILPGNTSRVIVPLKRIYLEDPHASIPALNPARQRQFVVSTGKISPDMERASREAFWYREKILDALHGTWTTATSPSADGGGGDGGGARAAAQRRGNVELRSMRLTARMIEAVKIDEVGIDVAIEAKTKTKTKTKTTRVVHVDEFVQLRVRVTNRTAQPLYPTLRLMPALCHRPLNVALDFTRKFAWNGALQQTLPLLGPRATTEVRLGVTALCRGEFEVTASVEETRLWVPKAEGRERSGEASGDGATNDKQTERRPRSNTETLLRDTMLGPRERRIWHSRTPCHFVVVDPPRGKEA